MIISRITDGLGNQLFQYACGRALANRLKQPLALDLADYEVPGLRTYQLNHFEVQAESLPLDKCKALRRPFRAPLHKKLFFRLRQHICRGSEPKYLVEKIDDRAYNLTQLRNAPKDCYLVGYWQGLEYIRESRSQLLEELVPKWPFSKETENMLSLIENTESVGVHIRRGDYTQPNNMAYFGLIPGEWYREAALLMTQRCNNPTYFIFCEDSQWARENITFANRTVYVSHNTGDKGYDDLYMLSRCSHHIIANSSFSWWGAWLAKPGGTVIAPKQWLVGKTIEEMGLLENGWITLG